MQVFDDVDLHRADLPGDVPRKGGATHIGIFFAWCVERGLHSAWHAEHHPDELGRLEKRWHTGRDYLLNYMEGRLTDEHLGPAGRAFAAQYYATGAYIADYEETLRHHHPTRYHVPDRWESVDEIAPVIDARFEAWRQARATPSAPPAPAAPAPAPPAPAPEPSFVPAALAPGTPEIESEPAVGPAPPPEMDEPAEPKAPVSPPSARTRPPEPAATQDAPHRTKKAWQQRKKGSGWVLVLIFALLYGCTQCAQSARKRKKQRRERERLERRERPRRTVPRTPRRAPRPQPPPRAVVLRRAPWPHISTDHQARVKALGLPVRIENPLGMRFVCIPPGSFVMGSPLVETGRMADEVPHNVEITKPFYLSITEVTNAQYGQYQPHHRSLAPDGLPRFDAQEMPVTSVTHEGATGFCRWLGRRDRERTYRLPTEAEWEYACRAGTTHRFWWGDAEDQAGRCANVADLTAKGGWPRDVRSAAEKDPGWRWFATIDARGALSGVARYRANPWGLYDMLGNVWEWCADRAAPYDTAVVSDPRGPPTGALRIIRGGAYDTSVHRTRCATRASEAQTQAGSSIGFRVVCTVD